MRMKECGRSQHGAVHDKGLLTDGYALGTGVQIDPLVNINARAQADMVGEPDTDASLDGHRSFDPHDRSVSECANRDADNGRHPPEKAQNRLLKDVTSQTAGLLRQVQPNARLGSARCPGAFESRRATVHRRPRAAGSRRRQWSLIHPARPHLLPRSPRGRSRDEGCRSACGEENSRSAWRFVRCSGRVAACPQSRGHRPRRRVRR
jgi:hypothetical protein